MPRRLAVARHAEGSEPIGWVLVGFLLGAALAIVALSHADWIRQLPQTFRTSLSAPAPAPAAPAKLAAVALTAAIPAPATLPQSAAPPAGPSAMAANPAPGEEAQVADDAAAAGMTSRSAASRADLN